MMKRKNRKSKKRNKITKPEEAVDTKHVKIWNVTVGGLPVKVATVEQGGRKESMCDGCSAPCCRGDFRPVLNEKEFFLRKFPTKFLPAPEWLTDRVKDVDFIATLAMGSGPCPYLDTDSNLCTVWPDCPEGCLSYDCREDTRDEIRDFANERKKIWDKDKKT